MDTYKKDDGTEIALGYWRCDCATANIHHYNEPNKCGSCGCYSAKTSLVPASEVAALLELGQ